MMIIYRPKGLFPLRLNAGHQSCSHQCITAKASERVPSAL